MGADGLARNGAKTEANHGIHGTHGIEVHHGGAEDTEPERKNHQWTRMNANASHGTFDHRWHG